MIWIYVILYILFALITFFVGYIFCVRKYIKEKSDLKFRHWIEDYYFILMYSSLCWFMLLPIGIIIYLLTIIINKINKHYNIE